MDSRLIDICDDIAARLRALAVDAEAQLASAERRELVEIALAVERLARSDMGGGSAEQGTEDRGASGDP